MNSEQEVIRDREQRTNNGWKRKAAGRNEITGRIDEPSAVLEG